MFNIGNLPSLGGIIAQVFSSSDSALQTVEQNPISSHYAEDTITIGVVANATPDFRYFSMAGYRGITIQLEQTAGTDSWDLDIEASVEGYTATEDWLDITTNVSFMAGSASADCILILSNANFSPVGIRTEITTADGNDDNTYNLFVKRWY